MIPMDSQHLQGQPCKSRSTWKVPGSSIYVEIEFSNKSQVIFPDTFLENARI